MQIPASSYRVYLFFLLLGVWVLLGATCDSPPRPRGASQAGNPGGSGSSNTIVPVAGSGANWSLGSLPPQQGVGTSLLIRINNHRANLGLTPLVWHDGLSAVAKVHSLDMYDRNYFSLVTPEGVDIYQRLVSSNPPIQFTNAYAFIVKTNQIASKVALTVYQALMANPVGKAAIENPTMTHFGSRRPYKTSGQLTLIFGKNVTP